jgi:hypothetical protein
MSNSDFLTKQNISMLWDIISDEDIFKFIPRDSQMKISQVFLNNINGFFEIEKKSSSNLIDTNKKYIMLILNHIKKNFSQQMPSKIKILEEVPLNVSLKELITNEEIQNDRKSQFEKDLAKRQEDFTSSMSLPMPEVPEFSDKYHEEPIDEMDKIIKEMKAKRNYDVEQINLNNQSDVTNMNWLKPQETSIKTEKLTTQKSGQKNKEIQEIQENYSRFKYLNSYENSDENTSVSIISPKKNVSWGENEEIINDDDKAEVENIFNKLKKLNKEPSNNIILKMEENINDESKEDKIEILQKDVDSLKLKIDMIIELLKQNK